MGEEIDKGGGVIDKTDWWRWEGLTAKIHVTVGSQLKGPD
jgi:hypothetical protein